ncbi:unnamed protein product, partial [Didymodactylos carnosus]
YNPEKFHTNSLSNDEQQEDQLIDIKQLITRNSVDHLKTDSIQHILKNIGVGYVQRIRDNQCLIEYDNNLLSEGKSIKIKGKLYKVEDCLLERAYKACGTNILKMLNIVCQMLDKYMVKSKESVIRRRSVSSIKSVTQSCCHSVCTISELIRYCPQ